MLAQRIAELLSPARGLRVLAIDRLDPPATLAVAANCALCVCAGAGCASPTCVSGAVHADAVRTAGFVRALVAQALAAAVVCPAHDRGPWPEPGAGCLRELADDALCTKLMMRGDSWTVSVGRGTKRQLSAASTLCAHCVQRVYGIQKTKKLAQIACFECRGPVQALLYSGLAGPLIADRLAASSPPFLVCPELSLSSPPSLACPEPSLSANAEHSCSDSRLTRPVPVPVPVPVPASAPDRLQTGCYDKLSRGQDARTGAVLRYSQGDREMHDGGRVLTPRSAVTLGLPASSIEAARCAKRRCSLPWTS